MCRFNFYNFYLFSLHKAFSLNITLNDSFESYYGPESQEDENDLDAPKFPEGFNEARQKVNEMIDENCVKERLNLEKYGNKELTIVEDRIIFASTELKCLKTDLDKFSELFLEFVTKTSFLSADYLVDSRKKLMELEPNYTLLRNFQNTSTEDDRGYFYLHPPYFDFEDLIGTLEEVTCGVLADNDDEKYGLKMDLIAFEENEKLKMVAYKAFVNELVPKLHKIAECFIQKL